MPVRCSEPAVQVRSLIRISGGEDCEHLRRTRPVCLRHHRRWNQLGLPVSLACAFPLPYCLAARTAPPGSGLPAWWQTKEKIRRSAAIGPRCTSINA